MTGHINGTKLVGEDDPPAAAPTQAQEATLAAKTRALLDAQIGQTIGTVVRGILVSAPGVDPRELLSAIARTTGNVCASSVAGELPAVLMIRKAMKEAFDEGVNKAPVIQPGAAKTGRG